MRFFVVLDIFIHAFTLITLKNHTFLTSFTNGCSGHLDKKSGKICLGRPGADVTGLVEEKKKYQVKNPQISQRILVTK
jgi:hypothetical protein